LKNSYVLGLGGEQTSEVSVSGTGPSYTSTWAHTNIFANGQLLATYNPSGSQTYFALHDWLGSKRMEYGATGCVESYFSLPYGNAQAPSGNCSDATEHHFTGKERDSESGNDYFGARYYASSMGRWLSPDWSAKVAPVPYAKLDDPQSLNLYTYVLNNPLVLADADGHSTDTYVPDFDNHGGPHIDRYNKAGTNVGRYRPDGTPMKHKGKTPPSIPNSDKGKFEKAKEKLQDQQQYRDDVRNAPGVPPSQIPDGLKPDPTSAPARTPCAGTYAGGPCDSPMLPFPNITPVPAPGPLPFPEFMPMPTPVIAAPPPGTPGTGHWEPSGNEVPRWVPNEHVCPGLSKC
jgi:RHS repeat-associated protein